MLICTLLFVFLGLTVSEAVMPEHEIHDLAVRICAKPHKSFSEISSVEDMLALINHFKNLPFASPLSQCHYQYLSSLIDLKLVLIGGSFSNDPCSNEKISAIEDFNRSYLSTTKKDRKIQKEDKKDIPLIYKEFFIHYANMISHTCKHALLDNSRTNPIKIVDNFGEPYLNMPRLDSFLSRFNDNLGLDIAKKGYDALFLPWKMMDNLHIKKKDRAFLRDILTDCSGDNYMKCTRLSIKMLNPGPLVALQHVCRTNMRPIYSKQVLPIIRLIALGLYEKDELLIRELADNQNLRRVFTLTQICETLLPIEVFESKSLKEGKVVALTRENADLQKSSRDETIQFKALPFKFATDLPIENPPMSIIEDISSIRDSKTSKQLVETINENRKNQEDVVGKMMQMFEKRLKNSSRSKGNHLLALTNLTDDSPDKETEIEFQSNEKGSEKDPITFKSVLAKIGKLMFFVLKVIGYCVIVLVLLTACVCIITAG